MILLVVCCRAVALWESRVADLRPWSLDGLGTLGGANHVALRYEALPGSSLGELPTRIEVPLEP